MNQQQRNRESLPIKIEFDPPNPKTGEEFKIILILDRPAKDRLTFGFEKQRFKFTPKPGEFPELRPTGNEYFELDPTNITVEAGKDRGESKTAVRKDAKDGDTGDPVLFPDNLVLTYFILRVPEAETADDYCIGIVKIRMS